MKKYIADALTLSRLVIAITILAFTISGTVTPQVIFWLFVAGQLSDAFDGIAARKWPFPEGHEPWYRRDQLAEVYEEFIDVVLGIVFLVYITVRLDLWLGLSLAAFCLVGGLVTECIAWGFPFGSDKPDRHTQTCFYAKDKRGCCRLILIRRGVYLAVIAYSALHVLLASTYGIIIKLGILGVAIMGGSILLVVKKDRLTQVKTRKK